MTKFKTRKKDKQIFPTGEGKEYRKTDDYNESAKTKVYDEIKESGFYVFEDEDSLKTIIEMREADKILKAITKSPNSYVDLNTKKIDDTDLKIATYDDGESVDLFIYDEKDFYYVYVGGVDRMGGLFGDPEINTIEGKAHIYDDEPGGTIKFTYKGKTKLIEWE